MAYVCKNGGVLKCKTRVRAVIKTGIIAAHVTNGKRGSVFNGKRCGHCLDMRMEEMMKADEVIVAMQAVAQKFHDMKRENERLKRENVKLKGRLNNNFLHCATKIRRVDDIMVPKNFMIHSPKTAKLTKCIDHYRKTGELDRAILVNKEGYLIDGYVAYLVCRMFSIPEVEVIVVSN